MKLQCWQTAGVGRGAAKFTYSWVVILGRMPRSLAGEGFEAH